jgi:hypothetical protein
MKANRMLVLFVAGSFFAVRSVQADEAVALVPNNTLIFFDTTTPNTTTARAVSGLGANETIRGFAYRPITGELFASTVVTGSVANSIITTYRIDPTTGVATLIGGTVIALPFAADVPTGYDFLTPSAGIDRIRYVNANDENGRLNPFNGSLSADDSNLTPAVTTTIIAAAYDRNAPDSTVRTLYEIDRNDSALAIQGGIDGTAPGGPNGGVVADLCPLGFILDPINDGGFDISSSGTAFAALTDNATGLTGLYRIDLSGCGATLLGIIGTGLTEVFSLAILPPDTDGDGVRDPLDGCPNDPAKTAPGVCGCGQVDTDSDGDGVVDCVDNCPAISNADQADSDGDLTGDACTPAPPAAACGTCAQGVLPATLLCLSLTIWGRRRIWTRR